MQTLTCDVCKKKLDNPINERTFFHVTNHDLCEACKDNVEFQVKSTIRTKDPFSYEWYAKLLDDTIVKAISKGK